MSGDGGTAGDSWSDGGTDGSWSRSGSGSINGTCPALPNDLCATSSYFDERVNLSGSGLDQHDADLQAQGFRLVHLAGYASGSATRYAALWRKCSGPPTEARRDLTRAQLQAAFDELGASGYRPVQLSGYTVAGVDLFAGIWVQRAGAEWESHHDLTRDEYDQVFSELKGRGYRLARVTAYGTTAAPRFATLWERCVAPPWEARVGITSAELAQLVSDLGAQGYRPAQIAGAGPGEERYATIWEKRTGADWEARFGQTAADSQTTFDDLLPKGYVPYDTCGVSTGSTAVINTLFTK